MAPRTTVEDLAELDALQAQIAAEERAVAAEELSRGRVVRYADRGGVVLIEHPDEFAVAQAVGVQGLLSGRRPRRSRRRARW